MSLSNRQYIGYKVEGLLCHSLFLIAWRVNRNYLFINKPSRNKILLKNRKQNIYLHTWSYFSLQCVKICVLQLVYCANFFSQLENGQIYGRSPVCSRTCVRKLKSNENCLPQPSNVHAKGFSPVWTRWWRFNFDPSKKLFPHSKHACMRGPCVWRCFRNAALSRNVFRQ